MSGEPHAAVPTLKYGGQRHQDPVCAWSPHFFRSQRRVISFATLMQNHQNVAPVAASATKRGLAHKALCACRRAHRPRIVPTCACSRLSRTRAHFAAIQSHHNVDSVTLTATRSARVHEALCACKSRFGTFPMLRNIPPVVASTFFMHKRAVSLALFSFQSHRGSDYCYVQPPSVCNTRRR